MSFKNKIFFSLAIFFVSAFALFFFKTIPHEILWNDWSVFFVEQNKVSDAEIERLLKEAGCSIVISKSNQTFPLVSNNEVFFKSFWQLSKNANDYLLQRENYFFDKSHNYAISYVKSVEKKNAQKVSKLLLQNGISSGVDAGKRYPILFPLALFAFAVFLFFIATKKKRFALATIFPLAFSFAFPFDASAWSMMLFLCGSFFALRVWNRKKAISFLLHHPLIVSFFATAFIVSCFAGVKSALLFFAVCVGSLSVLYLFFLFENFQKTKYQFIPIFIQDAKAISLVKEKNVFLILIAFSTFVFFASLFSFGISGNKKYSNIILPSANASRLSANLPNLRDYVDWLWNVETIPYRNVRKKNALVFSKPHEGDTIAFPNYQKSENGIMYTNETLTFNAQFYDDALLQIEKLPATSLEQMMKAQKKNFYAGYSKGSAGSGSSFSIFAFLLSLAVPLFFFVLFEKGKLK